MLINMINQLKHFLNEIETRKAKGAAIRAKIKLQQVGDKCSVEFFKSVRQNNQTLSCQNLRIVTAKYLPSVKT